MIVTLKNTIEKQALNILSSIAYLVIIALNWNYAIFFLVLGVSAIIVNNYVENHKKKDIFLLIIAAIGLVLVYLSVTGVTTSQLSKSIAELIIWAGVISAMILFLIFNKPKTRSPEDQAHYNRRIAELEAEQDFKRKW